MKTLIKTLLLVLVINLNAQEFQGLAVYKTSRKVDLKLDSTKLGSEMHKKMTAMLRKQFQKTFTLSFNNQISLYQEDETLAPPQMGNSNMQVMVFGAGNEDIMYKNVKEKQFVNQKDVYGKLFLVKDKLEPFNWKLESETKFIGNYQCYKATYTVEVDEITLDSFSVNNTTENENSTNKTKVTKTVTAWYTPQIPISNGPEKYFGLPGLILEINNGDQQIVCSKIVLNPEKKVNVSIPKKGKEVDQKTYTDIMDKKAKEVLNSFKSRKSGSDNGVSIEFIGN